MWLRWSINGIIHNIQIHHKSLVKFENHIGRFIQFSERIFTNLDEVNYSDSAISLKGQFHEVPLFDVGDAKAIRTKLTEPMLSYSGSVV